MGVACKAVVRDCSEVLGNEELLEKVEERSERFTPDRKLEFCQTNRERMTYTCIGGTIIWVP